MAKANFFMVELLETAISREIPYEGLKDKIVEVIDNNATKYNDFWVIELSKENELHYVADIFEYKTNYLFMRISKQKPSGGFIYRDYETNEPESLLNGVNETKKGIEIYTYALLDYGTGILSIVNQQGAPNHRVINYLFSKYDVNYSMNFVPIANKKGIERIYLAQEPCISQIEVEVPVPDAETLEKLFHWKGKNVLDMQGKKLKAVMKVSSVERKVITDDEDETKRIIDSMKSCLTEYTKARIRAKAKSIKTQDYNFFDDNFAYEVHVPRYTLLDGEKHYYSADELVSVYRQGLFEAYEESKDILKAITNR